MRAGAMRHRITLQSKSETRDTMGGAVITWTDEITIYAAAEPLQGREYFSAEQVQSEVEVRFRIRYFSRLRPEWRVLWEARPYEIVDIIDPLGRHIEQQLMAKLQKV